MHALLGGTCKRVELRCSLGYTRLHTLRLASARLGSSRLGSSRLGSSRPVSPCLAKASAQQQRAALASRRCSHARQSTRSLLLRQRRRRLLIETASCSLSITAEWTAPRPIRLRAVARRNRIENKT